jgi:hypothetical protein
LQIIIADEVIEMKAKVYLFRVVIGLIAFGLGIGIYWTIKGFGEFESEYPTCLNYPAEISLEEANIVKEELNPNGSLSLTNRDMTAAQTTEVIEDSFYAGGDYYLIGDLPKDFKDFDYLSISTDDWDDKAKTLFPIPPKGSLFMRKEHKFIRIAINNRQISFKTEKINGVSYEFTGNYPKEEVSLNNSEDYVYLQGRLIKFKDGKRIAEIEAKFGAIDGC